MAFGDLYRRLFGSATPGWRIGRRHDCLGSRRYGRYPGTARRLPRRRARAVRLGGRPDRGEVIGSGPSETTAPAPAMAVRAAEDFDAF